MHHFAYRGGLLHAEEVSIETIAANVGTPFYCYSEATLRRHLRVFASAFAGLGALTAFSVKSNPNLAVLRVVANEGAGADVVSGGELKRARAAGIPPERIVFSGVGKTADELALGIDEGIYQFNVESEPELRLLNDIATAKGAIAPVALRINPDVSAGGHDKISTGKAGDKFGVPWERAPGLFADASRLSGVAMHGVDVHIGSQIDQLAPFEKAFMKVVGLVRDLRDQGHAIDRLDLGGGLGISYGESGAAPPHPDEYAALIKRIAKSLDVRLIFEPGRMIVGNAGILVARVIYDKAAGARRFLVIDAAMNDLLRPALYNAYHEIIPVREAAPDARRTCYDVVGPVCESSDIFADGRDLPEAAPGELIAIMSAGAYGAAQSSQYNSRSLIPEVLVNGERFSCIRRRPDFSEMIALEQSPDWLRK